MKFEFNLLFKKNEEISFYNSLVSQVKNLNFFNILKDEQDILKKTKDLKTIFVILKNKNGGITNPMLELLKHSIRPRLREILTDEDKITYFEQVCNLCLFAIYGTNNNIELNKKLKQKIFPIIIGKLFTIINLLEYSDSNEYIFKTIDDSTIIESQTRQMELFHKGELSVNEIIVNKK